MAVSTLTRRLAAEPDAVFDQVADPHRLPDWNAQIVRVLDAPATLEVGAQWVVEMSALGQSWASRSRVEDLDRAARRFVHRSQTDDGNPSCSVWTWTVDPVPGGSELTVSWELDPKTFWRRALLSRIRQHQLMKSEVPASLEALAVVVGRKRARG
jgi:uncharacterized protein YndB with AHSA1/START domain